MHNQQRLKAAEVSKIAICNVFVCARATTLTCLFYCSGNGSGWWSASSCVSQNHHLPQSGQRLAGSNGTDLPRLHPQLVPEDQL